MKTLLEQFNDITLMKCFEIEDNCNNWHLYEIRAGDKCLWTIGKKTIAVDWDEDYSLESHLSELYDLCYADAMENEDD